jgi:hypothetical protein
MDNAAKLPKDQPSPLSNFRIRRTPWVRKYRQLPLNPGHVSLPAGGGMPYIYESR